MFGTVIAFVNRMNVLLKTSSDINNIQNAATKQGVHSNSKVSFDMFTFNSMMNDFKFDEVRSRPQPISRRSNENETFSHGAEEINKKPNVNAKQYSKKSEQSRGTQGESRSLTYVDKNENIRDGNNPDKTSVKSKELTASDMGKKDQCSDGEETHSQQPTSTENGQDRGHHIGLFLSNILNVNDGELIIDNLINEGKGSVVSELAQSGNKSEPGIDLKTGNLLSRLIKDEVARARTSGMDESQTGVNSKTETDDVVSKMNDIHIDSTETGTDGKIPDDVNSKASISRNGIEATVMPDKSTENPDNGGGDIVEETLMKVQMNPHVAEAGDSREALEDVSVQSVKNADESGRSIINSDKKNGGNHARHIQDNALQSGLKGMTYSDTTIIDKPLNHITENIHIGTPAKVITDSNGQSEGTRSETSNNGLLNSSVTAHEGMKAGAVLKTGSTTRPSVFHEVVDRIMYVVKGSTKLGVKVDSESLGKLNIHVSIEKGLVNVHINSSDKVVREFIENNMQQIVDSLSKNGVSVGGFSVGLRNNKNSEGNGTMSGNGRGNPFSVERAKASEYIGTASRVIHNNGLVNIFA
jgi:flagellar hook-length control protein FliK